MAFLEEFGEFAVHDLTWEKFVGQDDYGQPTYQAPVVLKARTDIRGIRYESARGHNLEARGESYFPPVGATARDRITIHTGEVVQVVSIWTIDDENGVPHTTELIFG
jgi:hypothetical protein